MNKSFFAKICIPIVSAGGFGYLSKGDPPQILLGLFLGFIIDIFWIIEANRKNLAKLLPLVQIEDSQPDGSPIIQISERSDYIAGLIKKSDEILFMTHTATGWFRNYGHEFEKRFIEKKKTILMIMDPDEKAFKKHVESTEWDFSPAKITLPRSLINDKRREELSDIDKKYSGPNKNYRRHFQEKYPKIVEYLMEDTDKWGFFSVIKIPEPPSIDFIRSRYKSNYFRLRTICKVKFDVILKNPYKSKFDTLLKVDQQPSDLFELYKEEFESISEKYNITF